MDNLNISELISAPFTATADAQTSLSETTINFIQKICIDSDNKVINVTFNYVSVDDDGNNIDRRIVIPLIALVRIPNLSIKDCTLEFLLEINEVSSSNSSSINTDSTSLSKTSFKGKLSSTNKSSRGTNTSATYLLKMSATDDGPTEAMSKILDVLSNPTSL